MLYLDKLIKAQAKIMEEELPRMDYSSDSQDYYASAKSIKRRLENIKKARDPLAAYSRILRDIAQGNYASDGICDELNALTQEDI